MVAAVGDLDVACGVDRHPVRAAEWAAAASPSANAGEPLPARVVTSAVAAFDGNQLIEVYSDQENPDTVFIWEKWDSRGHYDTYLAWRIENGLMDALAAYMDTSGLRIINMDAHPDV